MSNKQIVMQWLNTMPEEATWEELKAGFAALQQEKPASLVGDLTRRWAAATGLTGLPLEGDGRG